jgi:ATP-dependent Lon protease
METNFFDKSIPILALRNLVVFPGITVPIRVGRPQSLAAIRSVLPQQQTVGGEATETLSQPILTVLQKRQEQKDQVDGNDLYRVGVVCKIERIRLSDGPKDATAKDATGGSMGGYHLFVRGVERVRILEITSPQADKNGLLEARIEPLPKDFDVDSATAKALLDSIKSLAQQILMLITSDSEQMIGLINGITDLDFLINVVASHIETPFAQKQELLELTSVKARALRLLDMMQHARDELQVRSQIREKLSTKLEKSQRDAILREQMRAIQEELGGGDSESSARTTEDYRTKIDSSGMPEAVKKVALDELRRFESLGQQSPETHVVRNFLDLLVAMPWTVEPEAEIDLAKAREILDHDHYGLDKIKRRLIEHLATMKLKGSDGKGLILLFQGPPGVGKTSLGQSIARALGRKFVRVSLGGVRDDAEIRGHRRTYVGAMPGRIIQGIKRAGSRNPVFLLDEIDKLGRGYQGDPAAALLEVLDPEQNSTFNDHYLDVPFDLSRVLFIATANQLDSIPGPLLDRMEVIELSGYTANEKMHIARQHLLPKLLEEHGLKEEQIKLTDEGLLHLISHYTREAGVRDLSRKIADVLRASTIKVVEGASSVTIDSQSAEEALGPVRFEHEVTQAATPPGVTTGLAWTPVGGEILFIESALMPGNGKLTLTGQLGDVMKESAQIALTLIRSRLPQISATIDFDRRDLHIHVPAGAIPKDGPSAGVAILTSIASLFTGRAVNPKLAMTGEVTLRGAVTPVGGIKEKVMAAHRAGVERIILSRKNERDLRDIPEEVKRQLKFDLVDDIAEVLRIALGLDLPALDLATGLWGSPLTVPAAPPQIQPGEPSH